MFIFVLNCFLSRRLKIDLNLTISNSTHLWYNNIFLHCKPSVAGLITDSCSYKHHPAEKVVIGGFLTGNACNNGEKSKCWLTKKKTSSGEICRGPFLEGPEKLSYAESHSKISHLMFTELLYSRIININRGSLHRRSFSSIYFSVFSYRWTNNGFTNPKSFRGFRETDPCCLPYTGMAAMT